MVTYDGINIFGAAVQFQHLAHPTAAQINTFFGVTGTQALYGGGRGRMFLIRGLLLGGTIADLNQAEANFSRYADGLARPLVDPRGRVWPNVIFRGEFTAETRGPFRTTGGWVLPYRSVFHGLT
jgi:hypothetical protein